MTIGWAQVGVIWGRWVCTVLVRPSRYTYGCCNVSGDFTVNVPYPEQGEQVLLCGTKSGRDCDKFRECGFTAGPALSEGVRSPFIAECGLAYECRTVLFNEVVPENLATTVAQGCYPQGDFHRVYFGEILAVHADEDFAGRFSAG